LIIYINQRDITGNYSTLNTLRFVSTKKRKCIFWFLFSSNPTLAKMWPFVWSAISVQLRKTSFNIHYIFGGLCVYPHELPPCEETDFCFDMSSFHRICCETHSTHYYAVWTRVRLILLLRNKIMSEVVN